MVYCSFASMFIAQAYNIHLSFTEVTVLMLTLMLASKGIAGVPRSSLVVLAATIPSFNIPVAGIISWIWDGPPLTCWGTGLRRRCCRRMKGRGKRRQSWWSRRRKDTKEPGGADAYPASFYAT